VLPEAQLESGIYHTINTLYLLLYLKAAYDVIRRDEFLDAME
jgi:hypothetical protein